MVVCVRQRRHAAPRAWLVATLLLVGVWWQGLKLPTGAEAAQVQAHVFFILDSSGSMWGELDGRSKYLIAREQMSDVVRATPEDFRLGLIVYGHRRKRDCTDIETRRASRPKFPWQNRRRVK